MMGTCGPYNLSGFAIAGIGAWHYRSVVILVYKTSKWTMQINFKFNLVRKGYSDSPLCFLRMPRGVPFVMTRAEGTEAFSYAPEYFVHTTQIGPNLVECYASVLLHLNLMTGPPKRSHTFSSMRSTPKAIVQVCSYNALTCLRHILRA